jgi:hypothetical protein
LLRILRERRLEFAFEMDRFFTLKVGQPMVRNAVEGDYADGTGTKVESTALQFLQAILNGNFLFHSLKEI